MPGYQPRFTVSAESINLVSEIASLVTKMDIFSSNVDIRLRKKNRVRSIQSSLEIEANSLTVSQVTDIIEGKRVIGPQKDVLEVKNAIDAYGMIPELDPYSVNDLLRLHGVMMRGLTEQSGKFRTVGVNVVNSSTGEVIHYAPHPDYVPGFIKDLMQWASSSNHHPLIISCVFHHEFEYIHPFTDGNGRVGRLWQTLILSRWNPIFEWIPIESVVRDNQSLYYRAIRDATDQNDTSVFIDFMLTSIRDALLTAVDDSNNLENTLLEWISDGRFTTADEVSKALGVSERTVRRVLTSLKDSGRISREGSNKTGKWIINEKLSE